MDPITTLIQLALQEDIGSGDVTSKAIFADARIQGEARIYAKQNFVVSALGVAQQVFQTIDADLQWKAIVANGEVVGSDQTLVAVQGSVLSLLKAERVALNFMQRLSGIATHTRRFIEAVQGTDVILRDTRKTTPGWRQLEKAATRDGGAQNHRMGLYDQFLIKDNHIDVAGSIEACVAQAKLANSQGLKIQVEVRNEAEVVAAIQAGADSLLLDNMTYAQVEALARKYRNQIELEVSGGVTLETVGRWAKTKVHAISIGSLTHSATAVDIAMEIKVVS